MVKKLGEFLLEIIFPKKCPVCKEILKVSERQICESCKKTLKYTGSSTCCICGRPVSDERKEYCSECEKNKKISDRYFVKNYALLEHNETAAKIIYDFKYNNNRDNIDFLVEEIYRLNKEELMLWEAEVIIPVPLHKSRYIERGFNQSEIFAKKISELSGITTNKEILIRKKRTVPQKDLDKRDRKKNIENSFKISNNIVKYKKVILVDDIYTTGSTLDECAKTLRLAGIDEIYCITISIVI